MYIPKYHKEKILLEQALYEIYSRKGEKKFGKEYVYNTLANGWIGVSKGTFLDHTNKRKYFFPGEQVPLYVEATLRSLKRNREMAIKYETGQIALSDIPLPEFQDLHDTIIARRKRKRTPKESL